MKEFCFRHISAIMAVLTAVVILFGSVIGYNTVADYEREDAYQKAMNSVSVVFEGQPVVEYGSDFDNSSLVAEVSGDLQIVGEVDTMKTGQYPVSYIASTTEEEFNQNVEKEYERLIVVKDTQEPEINLKEDTVTIKVGDEFDAGENIESVKDPVDGKLKKTETLEDGSYTITDLVDTEKAGEYKVNIDAMDINGNTETVSYTVVVKPKQARFVLEGYNGPVINRSRGTVQGPSGKETYYNLNMSGVVANSRRAGIQGEYWVREDGAKMLGDYILCACDITGRVHRRYDIVKTSIGLGICADTGTFAKRNPSQIDIATNW